jgi:hypothetical protein
VIFQNVSIFVYRKPLRMEMDQLLEIATKRFKTKNKFTDRDYKKPMDEFILMMYVNCDPASYGRQFVKKIMRDESETPLEEKRNLYYIKDWVDQGDLVQLYPSVEYFSGVIYDSKRHKQVKWDNASKMTIEVKISYLTKEGNYNIRNIRPYQDFDYFLFCFVDCENDFTAKFIMVEKRVITEFDNCFTLTPMNGTKKANKDNKDIGYGTSFKKGFSQEWTLEQYNLLDGTTYDSFKRYLTNNIGVLKETYEKSLMI